MSTLSIKTQQDLLQFIKQNLQGDRTLSIRGVAWLCGVDPKSIIDSGDFKSAKLAEKLIGYGYQAGDLVRNGFNAQCTWLTIEYFAYDSKAQALQAKAIARTFGAFGVMEVFNKLTEQQKEQPMSSTELILHQAQTALKQAELLLELEKVVLENKEKVERHDTQLEDVSRKVDKLSATRAFKIAASTPALGNSYRELINSELEDSAETLGISKNKLYNILYARFYEKFPEYDYQEDYRIAKKLDMSLIVYLERTHRISRLKQVLRSLNFNNLDSEGNLL